MTTTTNPLALATRTTALATALPAWLDRNAYPFTPARFATRDGELAYLDEGRGPVVLFVHGTPSWSFEARALVRALAPDHRVVVPDHLGFGLSDKPVDAPLDPASHAHRLRELVERLDLRDVTLVVHDFGGPIGLPLALDTSRIARVVLLNTWMWSSEGDRSIARLDRFVRSFVGRLAYRWGNLSARVLLPASFGDRKALTKDVHRQYLGPFAHRRDREGTYAMACALRGSDPYYASLWAKREALQRLPVSVVWGLADPAFTEQHLARWESALPQAPVTRLRGCGHFVAEERPDAVLAAIRAIEGPRDRGR